ncbi:type II secretion system protein N [Klebsiella pneumoniae]|nr:type II secretion system protein N [Klebsiella pneumoniae]
MGPSRSAPTGGAAHRPRQPAQPLVDVDYARQGRGEVTFSLTEGRFSDGRCRHIIAGGAQWRQARLHSPVGSLELAQVNGTFRCTVDGAVALTLRQDSHQLSLSGQGLCRPMAAICFAARYSPGRDAAAAGAAGHAPDSE